MLIYITHVLIKSRVNMIRLFYNDYKVPSVIIMFKMVDEKIQRCILLNYYSRQNRNTCLISE